MDTMLQLDDDILIFRNNALYRASLSSLSDIIVDKQMLDSFNAALVDLSTMLDYVQTDDFMHDYYQKSELKTVLVTNEEVSSLTDKDRKYVLTEEASSKANSLCSESNLTAWRNSLFVEGVGIINKSYAGIETFWNNSQHTINDDEDIEDTGDIPYKFVHQITGITSDNGWG